MFDHMKKTKVIAALTAGVGVACDAYGSANADTAKLAQLQQQLASVNASATFAKIPAGTFQMGSPSSESGRYDNEVLHSVTIGHGFEMEVTDVDQLQWFLAMADTCGDQRRRAAPGRSRAGANHNGLRRDGHAQLHLLCR